MLESDIEIILWSWLKENGRFIKEIYFNRINQLNAPVFTTSGLNKKPDFIILIDRGYGKEYIAVEIKDNSKSSQVYDASKILMYYENYRIGATEYFINEIKIKLNHFVIATQGSISSKLFNDHIDIQIQSNRFDFGKHRECLVNFGNEPEYEWNGSSSFTRKLFSEFRKHRKDNNLKDMGGPSIGIITSKIELGSNKEGEVNFVNLNQPHLFIMNYNNYNPNYKPKWGCRFWEI